MMVAHRLQHIHEYYFSSKLQEIAQMSVQGADIINLGIGNPDLPPPKEAIRALFDTASGEGVHGYQSYRGDKALRTAMQKWYALHYHVRLSHEEEILPLIGSKEGIVHICMTYLNEGDKALVPNPGYPAYDAAIKLAGATPLHFTLNEENDFEPDFKAIETQDLSKVKLMWVNYPNMPTGKAASKSLFEKLIAFGKKHHILICHDNPYSFILNDLPLSIMAVDGAKDTALELNSLSKTYNMAGWRVGMLIARKEIIDEVLKFKSNMDSGMFLPLQLAAAKVLETSLSWHKAQNEIYNDRKQKAIQLLQHLGAAFSPSQQGMFLWAKVPAAYHSSSKLCDYLLYDKHIFVAPGFVFGSAGEGWFRLSLCCPGSLFDQCIYRLNSSKIT